MFCETRAESSQVKGDSLKGMSVQLGHEGLLVVDLVGAERLEERQDLVLRGGWRRDQRRPAGQVLLLSCRVVSCCVC